MFLAGDGDRAEAGIAFRVCARPSAEARAGAGTPAELTLGLGFQRHQAGKVGPAWWPWGGRYAEGAHPLLWREIQLYTFLRHLTSNFRSTGHMHRFNCI